VSALAETDPSLAARRTDVKFAWSDWDARQKAANFLGASQAHREAIVSLGQCRSCHDGNAGAALTLEKYLTAAQPTGPWIGVSVAPADGVLRSQLRLPEGTGVVVTQVVPNGPAQQAGIEQDDVLLSVNGKPVATGDDLDKILQAASPDGPALTLKVLHAGEAVAKRVTPRKPDSQTYLDVFTTGGPTYRIGVLVTDPDQTLRRQLKLGDAGLVVQEVQAGKPADAAGVKSGDVLLSANGKPLTRQEELTAEVMRAAESPVKLELLRGGVRLTISATPVKQDARLELDNVYLALRAMHAEPARDLVLVQPNDARELEELDKQVAATTQPAIGPKALQLDRLADQVEQLRQTVDRLRAEVEKTRTEKTKDGK
jgi:membrane-associated protease RseP (regulator of RpoE activity)